MLFENLNAEIHFIILESTLCDVITERLFVKKIVSVLDFKPEEVNMNYNYQTKILPLLSEYFQFRVLVDRTDSKDVTSGADRGKSG